MLSNISVPIEQVLSKTIDDDRVLVEIKNFLTQYKNKSWIYPGVIKRKFNVTIFQVYQFLSDLEEAGYVKGYYELYCGNCNKHSGINEVFETLALIPETFICESCGEETFSVNSAILIYKVLGE
ncbi:MAG TPA: hypothetical protein DEF30_08150 [Proteiniclasticum sp.]|uniref:hypothetical protein n=1 Tax=Proteiniclasticum sp. TaxID=2053595 RepID=UPI000E8B26EC|nr:hypothetical protein [Proteiniclasticum sp.]HBW13772.1 hypothetical protein [Proteiniclasticum sp.]